MSSKSAFRRVVSNLHATFWLQLLGRFGSLITVPVFLRTWPAVLYGEYLTLFSVVGYLATLDFGVSQAVVNRLTQFRSLHQQKDYETLQRGSLALHATIFIAGALLLAAALPFVNVRALLNLVAIDSHVARTAIWLLGASVLLGLPIRILLGTYSTVGLISRTQWVYTVQTAANLVATVSVLLLGGSILMLAGLPLFFGLSVVACVLIDLRRNFPECAPRTGEYSLQPLRGLMGPSLMFVLLMLTSLIWFQGTLVLAARFFGGAGVAIYSVSRTLSVFIRTAVDAIGNATWAEITRLQATERNERVASVYRQSMAAAVVVATTLGATIWVTGGDFIQTWTSGRLVPDILLLRLLVILQVSQVPWQTGFAFVAASNRHKEFSIHYFSAAVLGLLTSWALVGRIGIIGIPVGMMVGEAVFNWHFVSRATMAAAGQRYTRFAPRTWTALLLSFASCTIAAGYSVSFTGSIILRIFVCLGVSSVVSAAIAWYVLLERTEKDELFQKLRRIPSLIAPNRQP